MTESPASAMMDTLTREVLASLSGTPDERVREVSETLVRHLHALVRELELTDQEWAAVMSFLKSCGDMSDDSRQEFILLSDTLGVSSMVDLVNHTTDDPRATAPTILGPFYVPDSPWRSYGESMREFDDGGEPAVMRGRVLSVAGEALEGAVLDVWQNSANGYYAVQQPEVQGPTNLRGRYSTRSDGSYEIRLVRPVPYPIPADGPVGQFLTATGRHPMRAAHVHVKVSADGYLPLTTHVFDAASGYLDSDAVFGVKGSLVREFRAGADGASVCEVDFTLAPAAPADPSR